MCFVDEEASLGFLKIVNVCITMNHGQLKQCAQPLEVLLLFLPFFPFLSQRHRQKVNIIKKGIPGNRETNIQLSFLLGFSK